MKQQIRLNVNGDEHLLFVDPWRTLNEVLREDLNLTGTKLGLRHRGLRGLHGPGGRGGPSIPA